MIEELVRIWNSEWKFDYIYRRKYKIAFNSPEHRAANQIDIKFDFVEEQTMERDRIAYRKRKEDLEQYKLSGKWLKKTQMTKKAKEVEDDLFGSIDIDEI